MSHYIFLWKNNYVVPSTSTSDPSQILLQMKLHWPRLPQELIVRTRLIELLNQGTDRQITLVCAPAGFGKTSLGLYVTDREAYEMWKAEPERIKVLDVRTFEEYVLIGHAEMAANVPLAFPSYKKGCQ
jgi:hypothetical protein